jgi:hypothetical protein
VPDHERGAGAAHRARQAAVAGDDWRGGAAGLWRACDTVLSGHELCGDPGAPGGFGTPCKGCGCKPRPPCPARCDCLDASKGLSGIPAGLHRRSHAERIGRNPCLRPDGPCAGRFCWRSRDCNAARAEGGAIASGQGGADPGSRAFDSGHRPAAGHHTAICADAFRGVGNNLHRLRACPAA